MAKPRKDDMPLNRIDMVDKKFGELIVLRKSEYKRNGQLCWVCLCTCGQERTVDGTSLRRGSVRNCGRTRHAKRNGFWQNQEHMRRYASCRSKAKQRGLVFELSREGFIHLLSTPCYYCQSTLQIGIDRRNSSQGYTASNSVSACRICNYGKNKITEEEFKAYINHIRNLGPVTQESPAIQADKVLESTIPK